MRFSTPAIFNGRHEDLRAIIFKTTA